MAIVVALSACAPSATSVTTPTFAPTMVVTRTSTVVPASAREPVTLPTAETKAQPTPRLTPAVRVRVYDDDYDPNVVSVKVGEVIEWYHTGLRLHTITASDFSWDSGGFVPNELFRMSFSQPGNYLYYCIEHPSMRGIIVVTR